MSNKRPDILLIEDNADTSAALVRFLRIHDYAPTLCATAADAMAAAGRQAFDAIITDIHLPDINGLVLSKKLRDDLGPDVPIIVLSADTSTETLKSLSHVGATYFLNKPVNLDLLVERLDTFLHATR